MQPAVASFYLALALFAVPANAGVYAPSLLTDGSNNDNTLSQVVFRVLAAGNAAPGSVQAASQSSRPGCEDDPSWVDQDGDGCAAYARAIDAGHIRQEEACGFEQSSVFDGDFQGAASHCRVTCGTCDSEAAEPAEAVEPVAAGVHPDIKAWMAATQLTKDQKCIDDVTWTDSDGHGCDVYAMHIQNGVLPRSVACGFDEDAASNAIESGDPQGAAQHCPVTCGTCYGNPEAVNPIGVYNGLLNVAEQMAAENAESDPAMPSSGEKPCKDDPNWVDMDGDGCAAYSQAIATGWGTQAEVCGRVHMELLSGNPAEAAKYCPATCGNCNLEAFEDNDVDMKDMIRLLVEQESETILKSAYLQEAVEEERIPEVTTTTTTGVKKFPEAECSTNSTWIEYWNPEADDDKKELSQMDLLKMASDMQPQQSRWLQMLSSQ